MSLNKVNYVHGQTIISAKNMNEIQDEVIRLTELIEIPSSGVVKTVNGVEPDENGNVEVEVSEDVVLYTAQTLTEQQKTQVRTNIGAQKTLNFDTTPISGSTNPVTSDGLSSKFATQDENIEMASMAASIAMPGSLKWDGYVGDKECVIVEEGQIAEGVTARMQFVHVSDYVPEMLSLMMSQTPTEERTLSALCSMSGIEVGGMHQVTEISVQVADDMFIMNEGFVYVPTDGYLAEGIMFPKKGWYFMSANLYLSGIEIPLMCVNGLKIEGLNFPDSNGGGDTDKYFEEITTVSGAKYVGDTLTWDGNTDGRVHIEITETPEDAPEGLVMTQRFVKMSDSIPTEEDFKNGCSISMYINSIEESESQTEELTYDDMVADGLFLEDGCIQAGPVFIIPYDNYTLTLPEDDSNTSFVFPEAGIYFIYVDIVIFKGYSSSLTIPGYNFSTATYETIDVIKTEHLPEHLRFGEITTTTGGSDTLTWDGNTDGLIMLEGLYKVSDDTPTLQDMQNGISFTITDGNGDNKITISAEEISEEVMAEGPILIISEMAVVILTIPYIVYPAGVYFFKRSLSEGAPDTWVKSFTINGYNGFKTTTTEFKTIDPKYLPDGYGGGSGGGTGLPTVSTSDNNKTVKVVNGEWKVTKLSYTDLTNTPSLSKVATSGSYTDLKNTPIPTASSSDEGAFLRIVNGEWTIAHLPSVEEGEF